MRTAGRIAALVGLLLLCAGESPAQDRAVLGWGRMLTNDAFGDGRDRWRTGAFALSVLHGPEWTGHLPEMPGHLLEYRFRAEVIAPATLALPAADDRPYAGVMAFGLHSHQDWQGFETSLGVDLVVTGPQTGLERFQSGVHEWIDLPGLARDAPQIPDGLHPTLVAEVGRSLDLGRNVTLRPFFEAQAGLESFLRVGADVVVGRFGQGGLLLRDHGSGQRYLAIRGDQAPGFSLTLGGDVAQMFASALLPRGGAADLIDQRSRLRAGLHWQGERFSQFYGLTWLNREFDSQPDGQLIGSLNLTLRY